MVKKWYRSRILYVNAIGIAIILATVFGYEDVGVEILAAEGGLLAFINFVLRLVTNQGLSK